LITRTAICSRPSKNYNRHSAFSFFTSSFYGKYAIGRIQVRSGDYNQEAAAHQVLQQPNTLQFREIRRRFGEISSIRLDILLTVSQLRAIKLEETIQSLFVLNVFTEKCFVALAQFEPVAIGVPNN